VEVWQTSNLHAAAEIRRGKKTEEEEEEEEEERTNHSMKI